MYKKVELKNGFVGMEKEVAIEDKKETSAQLEQTFVINVKFSFCYCLLL